MTNQEREYIIEKREEYDKQTNKHMKQSLRAFIIGAAGMLFSFSIGDANFSNLLPYTILEIATMLAGIGGLSSSFIHFINSVNLQNKKDDLSDLLNKFKEEPNQEQEIEKEGKSR